MDDQDMVITPGGIRPRLLVHTLDPGDVIDGSTGQLLRLNASGALIAELGKVDNFVHGMPLMPLNANLPASTVPAFGTGWITFGTWTKSSTEEAVSSFRTQWVVPPEPIARDGQLIYLFNGMQNSTGILQPVLQWGTSPLGGESYWAVASWFVNSSSVAVRSSKLVRVKPGDILTGEMKLTSSAAPTSYSYSCGFLNLVDTYIEITNIPELTNLVHTLECYGITRASDYPAAFRTPMRGIDIRTDFLRGPNVTWASVNRVTDCGQHTTVVSNSTRGGEVDLCYGTIGPSSIAAVASASDRLDIFGLGVDRQMYHKAWNASQWLPSRTDWEPLGGTFNSPPAAVSWGPERLDIVGLGLNNQMYHKAWNGSQWLPSRSDWEPLGGIFGSPPTAVTHGADHLDIFALGADRQMYHKAWDGTRWRPSPTDWDFPGGAFGVFNATPSVVSWASNRLDVFALGSDNRMYHRTWDTVGWQAWEPLGGVFNSAPAVASWGPGRLDVLGLGLDNQMYHKAWDGTQWLPSRTGWEPLGGVFNSAPAVASWGPRRLDVFGLGLDNQMYHKAWDGTRWSPSVSDWQPLGGVFDPG
jgi:hypothetical protein